MTVRGRTIELWVEGRAGAPAVNPVMRYLLDQLRSDGASVRVRVPEWEMHDAVWFRAHVPDLILLKTPSPLALSLAAAAERAGVRFLNRADATIRANNKAGTVARLAAAGLPVPETWLTLNPDEDDGSPPMPNGAVVSKPVTGIHGAGVVVHQSLPTGHDLDPARQQAPTATDDGTRLIQRRIGGDEPDVKVYVADRRCFAGRKAFSPSSFTSNEIEPVRLDPAIEEIIHVAGEVMHLACFGVDLRFDGSDPYIIDINPFPGYRSFPDAANAIRAEMSRTLVIN